MNAELEEQEDELLALESIFSPDEFLRTESKFAGEIRVSPELPDDFSVLLKHGGTLRHYDLSFLPPLLLNFDFPEDYPSSSPPSFTLTCSWMTHTQLTSLSDQLTHLYQATGGSVVLFSWIHFLREEALKFLDIHSQLELPSDEQDSLHFNKDKKETEPSEAEPTSEQCCNVSRGCNSETPKIHSTSERSNTVSQEASALVIQKVDNSLLTSVLSQSSLNSGCEADDPNTTSSEAIIENVNEHVSDTTTVKGLESDADSSESDKSKFLPLSQHERVSCNGVLKEEDVSGSGLPHLNSSDLQGLTKQEAASLPVSHRDSCPNADQTFADISLTPSQILLSQILIHNASQKQKAFATTLFDCGVCYMSWLGSECMRLHECGHIFCQACLREFCKGRITEGNVRGVTCPQEGCTAIITPAQVKSLVGEELFRRYDRLLLQVTLDSMSDVTYCPRSWCGLPVICEKSSKAALCTVSWDLAVLQHHDGTSCSFAFCVHCRKTYHGTNGCHQEKTTEETGEDLQSLPLSEEGLMAILHDYRTGSRERRRLLESRYGRRSLRSSIENHLNERWKVFNTKGCPHCFVPIQKDGGCSHMWCIHCDRPFTWTEG